MPIKLSQWFAKHKENFLSHPVFPCDIEAIRRTGTLMSDEARLRENQKLILPNKLTIDVSPIIEYLSSTGVRLPDRIKIVSSQEIGLVQGFLQAMLSQKDYEACFEEQLLEGDINKINEHVRLTKRQKQKIIITHNLLNAESYIYGVDSNPRTASYPKLLDSLYQKFRVESFGIQLANDTLVDEPIDARLAKVWEQRAKFGVDMRLLLQHLLKLREDEISPNILSAKIEAGFNRALWPYDCNIVILFTLPEVMFSASNPPDFQARKEVCLLHPLENHGEPLAINLKQHNGLVIGPKEDLKPFADSDLDCVSLEELCEEEIILLDLPIRLRPQSPLIKMALFAAKQKVTEPASAPDSKADSMLTLSLTE
jgi:hypothetical protein